MDAALFYCKPVAFRMVRFDLNVLYISQLMMFLGPNFDAFIVLARN